ncbi:MAG: excinuclease ABC subunit UvrA [Candidatus Vogelbacteria bacterium]|nr:excinuclease ABC subunit UvrA [Candidatus Vogelbacteria bacterium]
MEDAIRIKGARTHNLKNIDLDIPRNQFVVFTGLSGSGKSSLAFDTIFAEGQRRYVESLSAYARQFLRQMQKPDVDEITGLSPAISIDQKSRSNNPRSTVATITEIYDYMRVFYARVGVPHCLLCGESITRVSKEEIVNFIAAGAQKDGVKSVAIFAPVVRGRKGEYYQLLYDLLGKGYQRVLIEGNVHSLRERIVLDKNKKHDIDVVIDTVNTDDYGSNEKGLRERLTEDVEYALREADGVVRVRLDGSEKIFSTSFTCPRDGFSFIEVEPRLFSFNSPYGACPECHGLGTKHFFGEELCGVCNNQRLRPEALAVRIGGKNIVELSSLSIEKAHAFFEKLKLSRMETEISLPVTKEIKSRLAFMMGVGLEYLTLDRRAHTLSGGEAQRIRLASQLGSRLVGALYVLDEPTIGLHSRDNERLIKTLRGLADAGNTIIVVEHDEDTIFASDYLVDIGPGAGVHGGHVVVAGQTEKLITAKRNMIESRTLKYLRDEERIEMPKARREKNKGVLKIRGGKIFSIKNLSLDMPLGQFVAITGVSGSGKSTLLYEILNKNLQAKYERRYRSNDTYNCAHFLGAEYLSRVVLVDQSPIGRTPRSNPATYIGAWTHIRDLFAATPEARVRGWKSGRFSFNVKGGRCEACQGNGLVAVEMHFLPTVYVTCDVCHGKRFEKETLEIAYRDKNIYDILRMTVEEAHAFLEDIPAISDRLKVVEEVGLGYLELGQPSTTLSGGESQRIKIASELYRQHIAKTIYLLDEPTIGLHYDDVKNLLLVLQKLVDKGNSVVTIEHNMDVIASADYIIDMGPEGGAGGGKLVAAGTPEEVALEGNGHTAKYLKRALKKKSA